MRSIKSIIFIRLFCVVIIFFSVVSGVACYLTSEGIRQFVISDASTSLSFIVHNIESNYKSDLMALEEITSIDGFTPFDAAKARKVVQEFLEFPNIFASVHMYLKDGTLLFAERRPSMGSGPYSPKTNFYQKDAKFIALAKSVIEEKRSMASEGFFTSTGTLYQTYVSPVYEDKNKQHVLGILSGGVFPHWQKIDYLLKGLRLGADNFILITDNRGDFISSDGITEKSAVAALKPHTDQAARFFFDQAHSASPERAVIDPKVGIGKMTFIVVSRPIRELNLVVSLGVNTQRIDEKTRELSYRLLVAMILGLLLSVFASMFVGERLAKPFRAMAQTINEINCGNFSSRVQYDGNDEIGHLSKRINLLASKIEKSEYLGNLWSTESELENQLGGRSLPPDVQESGSPGIKTE